MMYIWQASQGSTCQVRTSEHAARNVEENTLTEIDVEGNIDIFERIASILIEKFNDKSLEQAEFCMSWIDGHFAQLCDYIWKKAKKNTKQTLPNNQNKFHYSQLDWAAPKNMTWFYHFVCSSFACITSGKKKETNKTYKY